METNKDGEMETAASGFELPLIPEGPFFDVLSRLSVKDLHRHTVLSGWRDVFINFPHSRRELPQTLQGFFYIGCDCRRHGDDGGDSDGNGDEGSIRDDGSNSNCDVGTDTDPEKHRDGSGNSSGGGSDRKDEDEDGGSGNNSDVSRDDDGGVSACRCGNYGLHFFDLLAKSMPVPDDTDTDFDFLPLPAYVGGVDLLCSCNGLLLFGCTTEGSESYFPLGYIVCNPATKQWVQVPSSGWVLPNDEEERIEEFESTFLFFDPAAVPSRFLLIQFWHDEDAALIQDNKGVRIYSSETREWSSNRSSEWKQFEKGGEWGDESGVTVQSSMGSCFLNGMLHFLVQRMDKDDVLVVATDGEGSIRRILHWPLDKFTNPLFIGQSQGRLHCISANYIPYEEEDDQRDRIIMSVDVLEDYEAEDWTRKFGIWGGHLSGEEECRREDYEVVAFHPDGDLVYFVDLRKWELIQCDMGGNYPEDQQVLRLCTLGPDSGARAVIPYVPCFSRSSALDANEASEN